MLRVSHSGALTISRRRGYFTSISTYVFSRHCYLVGRRRTGVKSFGLRYYKSCPRDASTWPCFRPPYWHSQTKRPVGIHLAFGIARALRRQVRSVHIAPDNRPAHGHILSTPFLWSPGSDCAVACSTFISFVPQKSISIPHGRPPRVPPLALLTVALPRANPTPLPLTLRDLNIGAFLLMR